MLKHWRYQILKHADGWYGLHEVYLNDDGKIEAHTERAEIIGDTPGEIMDVLQMMTQDAQAYPAIDEPEYGGLTDAKEED